MHEHTHAAAYIDSKESVRGFQYAFMIPFGDLAHGGRGVLSFMVTYFVSENNGGSGGKWADIRVGGSWRCWYGD